MSFSHPLSTQLLEIVADFETDPNSAMVRRLKQTADKIAVILDQQYRMVKVKPQPEEAINIDPIHRTSGN